MVSPHLHRCQISALSRQAVTEHVGLKIQIEWLGFVDHCHAPGSPRLEGRWVCASDGTGRSMCTDLGGDHVRRFAIS